MVHQVNLKYGQINISSCMRNEMLNRFEQTVSELRADELRTSSRVESLLC
ncbi:MAG: hypothetical protein RI955_1122 [Bacteroidota bacterium]|jgi:hypothetical protein